MTSATDGASRITLDELRTGRVGLVLMGGGAKGAYQAGVWRALWERGVRRFSVIAGTSVGALNGLLIADADPSRVDQIWRDVVAGGVLTAAASRRRVLLRVLSGYVLFFLPVVAALALSLLLDYSQSIILPVSATLVGAFVWLYANYLRLRRAIVPLLVVDVLKIREIGIIAAAVGTMAIAIDPRRGEMLRMLFQLALPVYVVTILALQAGVTLLTTTLARVPLFDRPLLNATIDEISAAAAFTNCSGPVWATLTRYSHYQNPFDVDWRFKSRSQFPSASDWRLNDQPYIPAWTPYYLDLRITRPFNWALQASSAIPYAFVPVTRGDDTFLDGGVRDNMPVAPAAQERPDVLILVGVNGPEDREEPASLTERSVTNWAKFLFSDPARSDDVDRLRGEWVDASRRFQGPDNLARLPADPGHIGIDPATIRQLWICPSRRTAPSDPIRNLLHGTMNFSPKYVDELIQLGYSDTLAVLDALEQADVTV